MGRDLPILARLDSICVPLVYSNSAPGSSFGIAPTTPGDPLGTSIDLFPSSIIQCRDTSWTVSFLVLTILTLYANVRRISSSCHTVGEERSDRTRANVAPVSFEISCVYCTVEPVSLELTGETRTRMPSVFASELTPCAPTSLPTTLRAPKAI